jgi:acyl-coenzyme A synthetase/AMP-(fatty) acid ligase
MFQTLGRQIIEKRTMCWSSIPCTTVKILDASGEECSPDEVGELSQLAPIYSMATGKDPTN